MHFSRGHGSRFNVPAGEFGVLYAAEDVHGAFIETFGRNLDIRSVTSAALAATRRTRIDTTRPLKLVDLASSGGLARLGADDRLTSGSFEVAQAWSRALWEQLPEVDGIYYRLRHDPARCGCAVFDRASAIVQAATLGVLWDPAFRRELADILDVYGFALIAE